MQIDDAEWSVRVLRDHDWVSFSDVPARYGNRPIPIELADKVAAIVAVTDSACEQHLDAEYAKLCRSLVERLARVSPSPLLRGDPGIWAAGVVHTVGWINFLFDRSQAPYLRADELAERLGVAKSTIANKSARIRALLRLSWYEPDLTRSSMLERNPFAWLVSVNGIPVDARTLPSELQDEARRLGLIPDLDAQRVS